MNGPKYCRPRPTDDGKILCGPIFIEKNQREQLRLSIDEYLGHCLLAGRIWFRADENADLRPGYGGWAIRLDRMADIIEALQKLEAEARAHGLVGGGQ
jgi:hypothetical protein